MKEKKDEELMAMLRRGNTAAFDLLFERYRKRIFTFLLRMLGYDRQAAEDLLQEVFMKVFRNSSRYEPRARFSTWLYTVARNECLNHIKSSSCNGLQRTFSLDETDDTPAEPEQQLSSDLNEALEQAVETLPETYKEVFLLHAVEGLTHEETGRILRMNPATVRTNYHRARTILQTKLSSVISDTGEK